VSDDPAPFAVRFQTGVEREITRLQPKVQRQVLGTMDRLIATLGSGGRPQDMSRLRGSEAYRIDSGEYRIVFFVAFDDRRVDIVRVRHRRDVYR
jgi:mRNA interferase RelE/StbE